MGGPAPGHCLNRTGNLGNLGHKEAAWVWARDATKPKCGPCCTGPLRPKTIVKAALQQSCWHLSDEGRDKLHKRNRSNMLPTLLALALSAPNSVFSTLSCHNVNDQALTQSCGQEVAGAPLLGVNVQGTPCLGRKRGLPITFAARSKEVVVPQVQL